MTAVATIDRSNITSLLKSDNARKRIEPMLRGVEYERVMGEVYLAVGEQPGILECTPDSIVRAVAKACSWGLVIGETVHLVPFNVKVSRKGEADAWETRCKAVQDYKGKIELIVGCGVAKSVDAHVVYEKEYFEHEEGTDPFIKHRPATKASERGAMIGAYAIADHGPGRKPHIKYMPLVDIDEIRQKHSKQWKQGGCPPWYAMKTCVHQLAKLLPKNPKLAKVLALFEEDETDDLDPAGAVATIAAPERLPGRVESEDRHPDCICSNTDGEADPNCPVHGEYVNEREA